MEIGDAAAKARRTGKALGAYGRIISVVPGTPEAGAARQAIDRLNSRRRWRRSGAAVAGLAAGAMAIVMVRPVLGRMLAAPPAPKPVIVAAVPPIAQSARPPEPLKGVDPPVLTNSANPVALHVPPVASTGSLAPAVPGPAHTATHTEPSVRPVRMASADPAPRERDEDAKGSVRRNRKDPAPLTTVPVTVHSKPFGEVTIDGKQYGNDEPPVVTSLPVGHHNLLITRKGMCEPFPLAFDLDADSPPRDIFARLDPLPATITLNIDGPPDTGITVDGDPKGILSMFPTKQLLISIPPIAGQKQYSKQVKLEFSRDGYRSQIVVKTVKAGETQPVDIKMTPRG
jgi:hypothetical protein